MSTETRIGDTRRIDSLLGEWVSENPQEEITYILTDDEARIAELRALQSKINILRFGSGKLSTGDFEHVQLTEEEKASVISKANLIKFLRLKQEAVMKEKKEREAVAKKALYEEWTAQRFFKHARERSWEFGKKLVENENTLPLLKALCFKLSNDPRYETELGYDLRKGLIVRGSPGLGKSYAVKLLSANPIRNIQIITMNEITSSVIDSGDFKGINFGEYSIVYFDDVGTEYFGDNAIKRYGSDINWFKSYMEEFYAKYPGAFHRLMFSTNDSFEGLEKKYGYRVRSRLAEMFDVIDVFGTDMRKTI